MRINLFAGGKRNQVASDEATTMVARFERESQDNEVLAVDISCRSWKNEAFQVLKPFLQKVATSVRYVNFADIIAGLMTEEGLGVTEELAQVFEAADLFEIDLSDNAMGPRGLLRVESLFSNSSLQRLYLKNCGLSSESMEMLKASVMADDGRIASSLTELVLDKNMIGAGGAKVVGEFLPHCHKLEYLSYAGCRPSPEGSKSLAEGLLSLTQNCQPALRKLDLEDCTFGGDEAAIEPLAKALSKCTQMSYLNLNESEMEIDGLRLLVDALTTAGVRLSNLYLDSCGELGEEGARVLADFLVSQATTLVCLRLNLNELGDSGVPILLEPFSSCKNVLEELGLQQNEIENEGAAALVRANLPNLRALNLEDNTEMPHQYVKSKYGSIAKLDEEDDAEGEEDEDVATMIAQFAATKLILGCEIGGKSMEELKVATPSRDMSNETPVIVAAVEGGGTSFVAAVAELVPSIHSRTTLKILYRTEVDSSQGQPQQTLSECVSFFLKHKPPGGYHALGVATFGPVGLDPSKPTYGHILQTTPKELWRGVDLLTPLANACRGDSRPLATKVETDVNAPALAEYLLVKDKLSSVAYVTVGTGVGVGLVINGQPVHGRMHPEGGHVPVQPLPGDQFVGYSWGGNSPFGGRQTVEGMASSVAITERLEKLTGEKNVPRSRLAELGDDHEVWEHAVNAVANLCVTLILTTSIEKIVIGGGIMRRRGLMEKIRMKTVELLNGYLELPSDMAELIASSSYGIDVGLTGALVLGQHAYEMKQGGATETSTKMSPFNMGVIHGIVVGAAVGIGAMMLLRPSR